MPEHFDDLAVPMDPAAQERLAALLVARLDAGRRVADELDGSVTVVELVESDGARAQRLRRWLAVAAAVALLVVALAVVVRSGRSSRPIGPKPTTPVVTTTTTAGPARDALGPLQPATGTPVTIGFVTDGVTAADNGAGEVAAAQAAAQYANAHLGGIAGRPIELSVCSTKNTSAGATACVADLVSKGAVAVVENRVLQGSLIEAGVLTAKLPFMTYEMAAGEGYGSNILTNIMGPGAVPVRLGKDQGVKRTLLVNVDVNLAGGLRAAAEPMYAGAGITPSFVGIKPDASDIPALLAPALADDPEQVVLSLTPELCGRTLAALRSLAYAGTIYVISLCLTPDLASQVPAGGLVGVKAILLQNTDPADPEVKLYHDVMAAYAPAADPDGNFTPGGFGAVLGLVRGVTALTGDVTPAAIKEALQEMKPQTLPLANSARFQCSGTLVLGYSALCSTSVFVATLDAQGVPRDAQPVDVTALIKP